jgi:hypothetical protein
VALGDYPGVREYSAPARTAEEAAAAIGVDVGPPLELLRRTGGTRARVRARRASP